MAIYGYLALFSLFYLSTAIHITVDRSGKGHFQKIQDAIDAVSSNNSENVFVLIKPGVYEEKIVVPVDKPFITLSGSKPAGEVIITRNESGEIFESPTFTVLASDFMARHLTIQNTYGSGAKAVALRVSADRAVFFGCRILSHQDTLLDDKGRHYYYNCYIQGDTDFICGNAASLFEKCHLHSLSKGNGAITAQHRQSPNEKTGFTFVNCKISGLKSALLGRPWGAYSRVVFALTYMSNVVLPQGWDDWGNPSKQRTSYYREYKCYGPGSGTSKRANWSRSLTSQEVKSYLKKSINGGKSWVRAAPPHFRRVSVGDLSGHVGERQP
ncbi:putative pectinesterase 11 [Olea europaea var. sylvestris]|uniref:pectinesterase n=1 Tax=Olea europaea subsp. europaea TaxID=158383 RepID=A0A8S0U1H2_OLEEU|nr:putative pectinesterase 11 [Olea europaea var. sylvestris]CAA3011150.1 pectinesterase 11 [Olea europaea subsp. europaea]